MTSFPHFLQPIIIIPTLLMTLLLTKCNQLQDELPLNQSRKIAKYFSQVDSLLQNEKQFWGIQLYGPVILIDPETRIFYANQNDSNNSFTIIDELFQDTLPDQIPLANTAFDWNGTRWTMVMLPVPENSEKRNNLIIHELFHRVQPELGFDSLHQLSTAHLDQRESRELLRLELESLSSALRDPERGPVHTLNALAFRNARQQDSLAKLGENSLEINEGICEYTGVMLSGRTEQQIVTHFINSLNRFYEQESYLRQFAYEAIPIYGFLLAKKQPNWHQIINRRTNLTDFFGQAFGIGQDSLNRVDLEKIRTDYNYAFISKEESVREEEEKKLLLTYQKIFIKDTTLRIKFENMNMSFGYLTARSLEGHGTVYPNIEISDNWGKLEAVEGALILSDWSEVWVSKPLLFDGNNIAGEGWKLTLKDGWKLQSGDSYILKKG